MNQKGFANIVLVVIIIILAGVAGYFAFVKKSEPITQRQTTTPAPTPTVQNTNLKIYTNTKYGYQITYPRDIYTTDNLFYPGQAINPDNISLLDIRSAQESIKCQCGEAESIVISAYPNPQKLSPGDYLKKNFQRWLGTPSNYSDFYVNESTTFNRMIARKFGTERDQYFLFVRGDTAFTITTDDPNVLKTFKFTNNISTNQNNCGLVNSTFRSVNQYEAGFNPNGVVMGYWRVIFKGSDFEWVHSDIVESGTYSCSNNILQAKLPNRSIAVLYDGSRKVLIWDGIEYKKDE